MPNADELQWGLAVAGELTAIQRGVRSVIHLDKDRVQDAVADTVVHALRRRALFPQGGRLGAWLYVIARRKAMNLVRQDQRQRHDRGCGVELHDRADRRSRWHDERALAARGAMVRAALDRVPARLADVLRLTALDGMSDVEAAAKLGISPANLRVRRSRARAHFQRAWESVERSPLADELELAMVG